MLVSKSNKFRFQQAVARTPHKPQVDNAKTATLEAGRYLDASPPRLILEIDIRKLLPAGVLYNEAARIPRQTRAAGSGELGAGNFLFRNR